MYVLFDDKNNIIGMHDEIMVVEEYANDLKLYHNINTRIKRVKDKKALKKYGDRIYDMELTAYREGYVPYKYVDAVDYGVHDIRNIQYCKDTLLNIYRNIKMSKREYKNIEKVLYLLDDIISDYTNYVESPKELETLKQHYDEMMNAYKDSMYFE
jgi:hypothetical protein